MTARLRAIIVDLDNTVFPSATIPYRVLAPAIEALRSANTGPRALDDALVAKVIAESWTTAFDSVATKYHLSPEIQNAWTRAMSTIRLIEKIEPFADVWALSRIPALRALVTTGYRIFQESKVAALDVQDLFDEIHIDALDDGHARLGKRAIFEGICRRHGIKPRDVLVAGDDPQSELRVGATLGMRTVQVLRSGVSSSADCEFHVNDFVELAALFNKLRGSDDDVRP